MDTESAPLLDASQGTTQSAFQNAILADMLRGKSMYSPLSEIAITRSTERLAYATTVSHMEQFVDALQHNLAESNALQGWLWGLEHEAVYTAGVSADPAHHLANNSYTASIPVISTRRGGKHTYHGPGQLVVYAMLPMARYGNDVRRYVGAIEQWVIAALATLGVPAFPVKGRVGVWTTAGGKEEKIAAIGIKIRRGIAFHGFSVNANPDLMHFGGIVPCGIGDYGVTSLAELGIANPMLSIESALQQHVEAYLIQ